MTEPRDDANDRPLDVATDAEAEKRADIVEDERRQRALDDGELGGEA